MSDSETANLTTLERGRVDLSRVPHVPVPPPGPRSRDYHQALPASYMAASHPAREPRAHHARLMGIVHDNLSVDNVCALCAGQKNIFV